MGNAAVVSDPRSELRQIPGDLPRVIAARGVTHHIALIPSELLEPIATLPQTVDRAQTDTGRRCRRTDQRRIVLEMLPATTSIQTTSIHLKTGASPGRWRCGVGNDDELRDGQCAEQPTAATISSISEPAS